MAQNASLSPQHRRSSTPTTSTRSSPSAYFSRNVLVGNLNNWFTELSINPLSILQTLTSPFRRRNGRPSPSSSPPSPATIRRSRSASYTAMIGDDESDFERPAADFLSGSLAATAKAKELIELARFGFVEVENLEKGVGHNFEVSTGCCCEACD